MTVILTVKICNNPNNTKNTNASNNMQYSYKKIVVGSRPGKAELACSAVLCCKVPGWGRTLAMDAASCRVRHGRQGASVIICIFLIMKY